MRRVLFAALVIFPFALAEAQSGKQLTIEAIFGDELSTPSPSQIRWMPDGNLSYFLSGDGGRDLWLFDTTSLERRIVVTSDELSELAPSPSQATQEERERTRRSRFGVPGYLWAPDGRTIQISCS